MDFDDFDYEKYSLEKLDTWVHDTISNDKLSPQQIYDVIYKAVTEDYYYHKHNAGRCYDLMLLFKGNDNIQEQVKAHGELWDKEDIEAVIKEREYYDYEPSMPPWGHSDMEYLVNQSKVKSCDKDDKSPECQQAWNDFWEENYYPEEYYKIVRPSATQRDIDQYSEEELNAMCDKAASDQEKEKCREYNLREAEYYDKRAELDSKWKSVSVPSKPLYVSEDGDVWIPDNDVKEDKVVKWQLPIEVDGLTGDCFVQFPDDLLEAADLKEGDQVEWVDQGNGSYLLKKVNA